MNVLHISNGYADSKVHSNLTKALDELGIRQTVYCPVREEKFLGRYRFEGHRINFVYSYCIKPWYKFVYHYKRWMLYKDMKHRIALNEFDIIHAPSLFSDGGLALKAYKEYGIPYVVAVRNTDINTFIKYLKHTYHTGREIALQAKKIFFISKAELDEFVESDFARPIYSQIKDKIVLQPNGIEDYWLEHISHTPRKGHQILYIGDFTPNKNVGRVIKAINQLRENAEFADLKFVIVGGGKDKDNSTLKMIESHPDFIEYLGKIYDKEKLASIMHQSALFVMPSIHETFGLVYLEALSQNLPVIYSKGQGIDGLFDESVGIRVNPLSVNEIRDAIRNILENPGNYSNKGVSFTDFNWKSIAEKYIGFYREVMRAV